MPQFRFELRCIFDGTIFDWPPIDQPPLEGDSEYDALASISIVCPGRPDELIPPHVEFIEGGMMEPRDCVEIINTYEVGAES